MKKILVVDDETDLLAGLKRFLEMSGYDVAVTTTCKGGVDILASFKPDIIFLDINVGNEDGREACRQIRSLADHRHTPIVLISADDDYLKTYREYDANSFLRKPFQPSQLLEVAASYLFPDLRA